MKIFKLQQNFFFKIIGISAILFFALDNEKDNPDSVARLINKENIVASTQLIKNEGKKIIHKTAIAQEMKKSVTDTNHYAKDIIIIDEIDSFDKIIAKCGNLVNLKIELFSISLQFL